MSKRIFVPGAVMRSVVALVVILGLAALPAWAGSGATHNSTSGTGLGKGNNALGTGLGKGNGALGTGMGKGVGSSGGAMPPPAEGPPAGNHVVHCRVTAKWHHSFRCRAHHQSWTFRASHRQLGRIEAGNHIRAAWHFHYRARIADSVRVLH
jgi:hypothetical protein